MLRARLLARLAGALRDEPSLEPRSSLSREAVEIARRLGDKETLVYALTSQFMATWGPDVDELVAITDEVGRLAEETGSADAALDALTLKGVVAWLTLRGRGREHGHRLRRSGRAAGGRRRRSGRARCRTRSGRSSGAISQLPSSWRSTLCGRASLGAPTPTARTDWRCSSCAARRVGCAEVENLIRDAVDRYPGYRSFRCFIPLLELRAGARAGGAPRIRRACRGGVRRPAARQRVALLPLDSRRGRGLPATTRTRAAVLYRLLAPYARVNAMAAGEVALGPVARYLGILATTTSDGRTPPVTSRTRS